MHRKTMLAASIHNAYIKLNSVFRIAALVFAAIGGVAAAHATAVSSCRAALLCTLLQAVQALEAIRR